MTGIQAIAVIVASLLVPFAVQLVKTKAVDGNAARWIAIGASIIAGVFAGLASGVPSEPAAWVTCVFATIGGVQIAYTAFKASEVTSKWLDALLAVGSIEGRK